MIDLNDAFPLSIFLIISFLAFYFLETIMLFLLNRLLRSYWEVVVDKILYTIVHHRNLVRVASVGSIVLISALLFFFTPLTHILMSDDTVFRWLALILLLAMVVIYWIGSSTLDDVIIEKRIHLYVYLVFSLLTFGGIMSLAGKSYATYQAAINQIFVSPIVANIEGDYERKMEDRLITDFRKQIQSGDCTYVDYSAKKGGGLTQFVFIKEDADLAEGPSSDSENMSFKGKTCIHQTKFLLTPEGKWYEVIE